MKGVDTDECDVAHPDRGLALRPDWVVERAAGLFRAVGDPARLRLLERLAVAGEHCVSELAEATGEGMSTISQRLRLLRSEELVRRRRDGRHVYYGLADDHVTALILAGLEYAEEDREEREDR
jgi:DNA-binding transcriptional ArsR family regulator